MKRKILIILLILEMIVIGITINIKINTSYNIFQYMYNNINQLFFQENPMKNHFPNRFNNYIDARNYVSNYVDENNAITDIVFTTKQNFEKDNGYEVYKTLEIKQTTKYNDEEINIIITSSVKDYARPVLIKNYYYAYDKDYKFSVLINISNHQLSEDQQLELFKYWFNNFKNLILTKVYENNKVFSSNYWGTFDPRGIYNKKFSLNESYFDGQFFMKRLSYKGNSFPLRINIWRYDKQINDDFNPSNKKNMNLV